MPKLIAVIESEQKRGSGTLQDPARLVTRYFTPDGQLLAEVDPWVIDQAKDFIGIWPHEPSSSDLTVGVPVVFLTAVVGGHR